jgi:hypothetical protein
VRITSSNLQGRDFAITKYDVIVINKKRSQEVPSRNA